MVLPNNPVPAATVDVTTSPKVQAQSSEPILKAGGGVAGVAALVVAILDRVGVPVVEGDATLITAAITLIVIPVATWLIARNWTVPVDKADAAIQVASDTAPSTPVTGFNS